MDNFFKINDLNIEIKFQSLYILYINIHLEKDMDLKNVFLRIFFWRFIQKDYKRKVKP
jgi:hypothetical protein